MPNLKIAIVLDDRLSRERRGILTRVINSLRQIAQIETFPGDIEQEALLERLRAQNYPLVIAPWYHYLAWSKVEAFHGLTRTSGPTFAGYVCDRVQLSELGKDADHLRAILLDFGNLATNEIVRVVRSLAVDHQRSGLLPLLDPGVPVFCDTWFGGQGLGTRMDQVLQLPELTSRDWTQHAPAVRVVMSALWGLVYEQGRTSSEILQAISARAPRAYFQVAADNHALLFRLCYAMPSWTPKDALAAFWPGAGVASSPSQTLLRYADITRVHVVPDTNDIEVTVGLFKTRPADRTPGDVHTLWIEPLGARLITECAMETPNAPPEQAKRLRSLVGTLAAAPEGKIVNDRFVFEAAQKIRELNQRLTEKDDLIRELKTGGVGGPRVPLSPPEAEALLDGFQARYHEAKLQIRALELKLSDMELTGGEPSEIEDVRQRIAALANREQAWIRKIAETIEAIGPRKKGGSGS